ncbi:hypothetical protein [Microbaculum sp. FT89]|uniref:hypothetical protein n=1 Tax=Microbaculum sp. FT89 TaxID=3447298 RepID=UPI003F5324EC
MVLPRTLTVFPISRADLRGAVLSLALALVIVPLPGVGRDTAKAAKVETPVCRVHLEKVDATLSRAQQQFEVALDTGLEAECAAMHGQVRALLEVRNIYRRCVDGPERHETVAELDTSIEQTANRIDARCAPRSAEAGAARIN